MFDNTETLYEHLNSHSKPDIILMDVMMPLGYLGGDELCAKLRKEGYNIPIVAVTGKYKINDIEKYHRDGFNDILKKPYTVSQLVDCINLFT